MVSDILALFFNRLKQSSGLKGNNVLQNTGEFQSVRERVGPGGEWAERPMGPGGLKG